MIQEVSKRFDSSISKIFEAKPEIKSFILNHERKSVVLNNLCEQIKGCEKGIIGFDAEKYHEVIDQVALLFSRAALNVKEADLVSYLERQRRIDEQVKQDSIHQDFQGEVTEETKVKEI